MLSSGLPALGRYPLADTPRILELGGGESPDLLLLVPWRLEKGGNVLLAHHLFLILEGQTKENLLSIFNTSLISSSTSLWWCWG